MCFNSSVLISLWDQMLIMSFKTAASYLFLKASQNALQKYIRKRTRWSVNITTCVYLFPSPTSCNLSLIPRDSPVHGYAHTAPVHQRHRLLQALIGHYQWRAVELQSRGQFHADVPVCDDLLMSSRETRPGLVPSWDTVLMAHCRIARGAVDSRWKVTEVPGERDRVDGGGDRQESLRVDGHATRWKGCREVHL